MTTLLTDPLYVLLTNARDQLNLDLQETLKNAAGVVFTHGPEMHKALCDRLIEENTKVREELNSRIDRRIAELSE